VLPSGAASFFVGVDVQVRRPCAVAVLDAECHQVESAWLPGSRREAVAALRDMVDRWSRQAPVAVGIDAPRTPLKSPRRWSWNAQRGWEPASRSASGIGRHCEVVIKALGLGNPQWTPLSRNAPEWMQLGFALFAGIEGHAAVHEVSPSAAYTQMQSDNQPHVHVSLAGFRPGPKDMLDAVVAAFVVREFTMGHGAEVGGGEGLGTIVLPRPVAPTVDPRVLEWPSA
jgi:predicted nuclease with RNAse H fold